MKEEIQSASVSLPDSFPRRERILACFKKEVAFYFSM